MLTLWESIGIGDNREVNVVIRTELSDLPLMAALRGCAGWGWLQASVRATVFAQC